ncbi:MAG: hypothetical protein FJ054_12720 [Cyanobacteria bacterium M_surface_10_m2_119]|nr:hypothetical protein [Cyanobacteria bacterium M_surface_10_m2_119]
MPITLNERLDVLSEAWNEAEIARPSLGRWLAQFDAADQPIALRLLECMQMHGWARLIRECRLLHQRLCIDLAEDGFDVERCSDIDFTRAFVCKSGDLISYLYRKANRLPVTCFHNIEGLQAAPPEPNHRRALVILDDYIGTGSQFLFTFVARSAANRALLQRYARVRLAAIVVHDDARQKWKLLQRRAVEQVMAIEEQQLTCVDFAPERQELITALASLDWRRAGLVAAGRDFPVVAHPQLSPEERQQLRAFLQRQQEAEGAGTTEFLLGHHSFFYGAPNALARVLLPLFKRIEDFSVYPRESQVGLPADLLDYDIDNPEPVTLHYPRS